MGSGRGAGPRVAVAILSAIAVALVPRHEALAETPAPAPADAAGWLRAATDAEARGELEAARAAYEAHLEMDPESAAGREGLLRIQAAIQAEKARREAEREAEAARQREQADREAASEARRSEIDTASRARNPLVADIAWLYGAASGGGPGFILDEAYGHGMRMELRWDQPRRFGVELGIGAAWFGVNPAAYRSHTVWNSYLTLGGRWNVNEVFALYARARLGLSDVGVRFHAGTVGPGIDGVIEDEFDESRLTAGGSLGLRLHANEYFAFFGQLDYDKGGPVSMTGISAGAQFPGQAVLGLGLLAGLVALAAVSDSGDDEP